MCGVITQVPLLEGALYRTTNSPLESLAPLYLLRVPQVPRSVKVICVFGMFSQASLKATVTVAVRRPCDGRTLGDAEALSSAGSEHGKALLGVVEVLRNTLEDCEAQLVVAAPQAARATANSNQPRRFLTPILSSSWSST
jgi:hypothetical protein